MINFDLGVKLVLEKASQTRDCLTRTFQKWVEF